MPKSVFEKPLNAVKYPGFWEPIAEASYDPRNLFTALKLRDTKLAAEP